MKDKSFRFATSEKGMVISMKKAVAAIAVLVLLLASCARDGGKNSLSYQQKNFRAEISYSLLSGEFSAIYEKSDGAKTLSFTLPETMTGVKAITDGMSVTIENDGLSFCTVGDASGIFDVTRLFEMPEECMRRADGRDGLLILSGESGGNSYTAFLDEVGRPVRLEGVIDGRQYVLTVENFTVFETGE